MDTPQKHWTVEHDKTKCALCVVCARHCPREALRRDEEGNSLALYFNASRCDGCAGDALCEENCPEDAITMELARPELVPPDTLPWIEKRKEAFKKGESTKYM